MEEGIKYMGIPLGTPLYFSEEKIQQHIKDFGRFGTGRSRLMEHIKQTDYCPHIIKARRGEGKRRFEDFIIQQAHKKKRLVVDMMAFKQGKGQLPYQQEYARRLANNLDGRAPRSIQKKAISIIALHPD